MVGRGVHGLIWSGLCPTRDRPDKIGWRKFRPAVDRQKSQIGIGKRLGRPWWKNPPKWFFSGENSLDLAEISSNPVRSH